MNFSMSEFTWSSIQLMDGVNNLNEFADGLNLHGTFSKSVISFSPFVLLISMSLIVEYEFG